MDESEQLSSSSTTTGPSAAPPLYAPPPAPSSPHGITKLQGTLIIVLLCAVVGVGAAVVYFAATNQFSSANYEHNTVAMLEKLSSPKYEYKVLEYLSAGPNKTGNGAFKYTSITPDAQELTALGAQGWQVVSSYLEMETAWPNFGDSEYVTGIQPNVRPQRVVVLLQRRLPLSN